MAYTYAEYREQKPPDQQERWICQECHREWLYARQFGPNWRDVEWDQKNCPVCGSPEIGKVRFTGFFDSVTAPDAMAQVVAEVGAEQLDEEARRRARLNGGVDASGPPQTLMPVSDEDIAAVRLAEAAMMAQGVPIAPVRRQQEDSRSSFAPEFG